MSRPRGFDHFTDYFKEFENDYVVIGGSAAAISLEDVELSFRATRDIDIVIFTNSSTVLNSKFSQYVDAGAYQTKARIADGPRYYRFSDPQNSAYPEILEIFARNETELELVDDQYILPIQNDDDVKLSAILLDDEYFNLIRSGAIKSASGYSIIDTKVNICLKARAFREMSERKAKRDGKVDSKDIQKHLKDIFRLVPAVTAKTFLPIAGRPRDDLQFALGVLEEMDSKAVKQFMRGSPITAKHELLAAVRSIFE